MSVGHHIFVYYFRASIFFSRFQIWGDQLITRVKQKYDLAVNEGRGVLPENPGSLNSWRKKLSNYVIADIQKEMC